MPTRNTGRVQLLTLSANRLRVTYSHVSGKKAAVIPLLKEGDHEEASNNRP